MIKHSEININTFKRCQWIDITPQIMHIVSETNIKNGFCIAASLHTTAGITINENADPDVERDFFNILENLVPKLNSYYHTEGNSDSHAKASLVGFSAYIPIKNGKIILGTWQSVYFCEFDGPRNRKISLTILGEN
jgi:secondary thiamine-phosphate synthase enzyme